MAPNPSELETLYGDLADQLPTRAIDGDTESFTFTTGNLPEPPPTVRSDLCWARNFGPHTYNNVSVDSAVLCLDKRSSTTLGLLILATIFHAKPEAVDVELGHPASTARRIRIRSERDSLSEYGEGLGVTPAFFSYRPGPVEKHPWLADLPRDPWHLPHFEITDADELGPASGIGAKYYEAMANRDTVLIDSSIQGQARFAELLLNAGLSDNEQSEFSLEVEGGYRGVAPLSAELTLWLPGGLGYDPNDRG